MLQNIIKHFFPHSAVTEAKPYGNGHINNTYKVDLRDENKSYILQRINTDVFKDPQGICDTHDRLQDELFKGQHPITIAELIPTADGKKLYTDHEGGVWRITSFIEDSYTIDVVEADWQAFEAGNAFGWFAKACDKLDANTFKESIKDFHRLSFRLCQLNEAIEANKAGRLESIKEIVQFYKDREASVSAIERLVDEGKIPLRVVHNDTKINNLLFRDKNAAAVIDLDTVGPGILYYDYGDALRTSASTAPEDEKDLTKVHFNIDAFRAFTKGYIGQVKTIVSEDEEELFYMAPMLMTYIMGIRFLADYLNGDVYYKVAHKEHNIDRSKVQKKLIESMEQQVEEMKQIIIDALKAIPV
ncbi:MAG: aminoglycoside phosphotransferase family protein [Bacteroidales bacterium]|nr:aminoglycoside phosphotransferase family protein [Bacteroidales bacterium]